MYRQAPPPVNVNAMVIRPLFSNFSFFTFLLVSGCASISESEKNIDVANNEKKAIVEEDKNKVVCRNV